MLQSPNTRVLYDMIYLSKESNIDTVVVTKLQVLFKIYQFYMFLFYNTIQAILIMSL